MVQCGWNLRVRQGNPMGVLAQLLILKPAVVFVIRFQDDWPPQTLETSDSLLTNLIGVGRAARAALNMLVQSCCFLNEYLIVMSKKIKKFYIIFMKWRAPRHNYLE